jgi:hypothetical protein
MSAPMDEEEAERANDCTGFKPTSFGSLKSKPENARSNSGGEAIYGYLLKKEERKNQVITHDKMVNKAKTKKKVNTSFVTTYRSFQWSINRHL